MNLGPHATFILLAYTLAAAVVASLMAWIWFDYRVQQRALGELEARGVTRRSDKPAGRTA